MASIFDHLLEDFDVDKLADPRLSKKPLRKKRKANKVNHRGRKSFKKYFSKQQRKEYGEMMRHMDSI